MTNSVDAGRFDGRTIIVTGAGSGIGPTAEGGCSRDRE